MSDSLDALREQLKQNTDSQALVLEITQRIAVGGSLGAMLPDIIKFILRIARADGTRVIIQNGPLTYATGTTAGKMIKHDPLIQKVAKEQGTIQLANLNETVGELSALKETLGAVVILPLIAQREWHGTLWIGYEQPQQFRPSDMMLLTVAAGQTAVAIANAYAFDEAKRGREQLAAILNSSPDPILVMDDKQTILLINPAAERAISKNALDVVGKSVTEVIEATPLLDALQKDIIAAEEQEWQNEHGQTFALRVSEMYNDVGEVTGRVLILRDITRYRNLRDNQAEFVSTVSHDLRSPLTYMHGYATMMPMVGGLTDKQKGFADKIISGIAQMTDLVDKILDASRLDPEGNYELNREACDVTKIVGDIVGNHQQAAEKKSISLLTRMDEVIPIMNLDDVMMRRALNNLVDNAIKYTPENGTVTVSAQIIDNGLVFGVRDTGLGISEENQKHLFERFRRVRRREHQTVKGNGLGLFIVRSVAQKHGGDAWVESKEGEGSLFVIRVPFEGNLLGAESRRADSEKITE